MLNANAVGDMLTNQLAALMEQDDLLDEAIQAKAEYIEKQIQDGECVMGHTLESIAEKVLEDDLAAKAMATLFVSGRTQFFINAIQSELTKVANSLAPKFVAAERASFMEY